VARDLSARAAGRRLDCWYVRLGSCPRSPCKASSRARATHVNSAPCAPVSWVQSWRHRPNPEHVGGSPSCAHEGWNRSSTSAGRILVKGTVNESSSCLHPSPTLSDHQPLTRMVVAHWEQTAPERVVHVHALFAAEAREQLLVRRGQLRSGRHCSARRCPEKRASSLEPADPRRVGTAPGGTWEARGFAVQKEKHLLAAPWSSARHGADVGHAGVAGRPAHRYARRRTAFVWRRSRDMRTGSLSHQDRACAVSTPAHDRPSIMHAMRCIRARARQSSCHAGGSLIRLSAECGGGARSGCVFGCVRGGTTQRRAIVPRRGRNLRVGALVSCIPRHSLPRFRRAHATSRSSPSSLAHALDLDLMELAPLLSPSLHAWALLAHADAARSRVAGAGPGAGVRGCAQPMAGVDPRAAASRREPVAGCNRAGFPRARRRWSRAVERHAADYGRAMDHGHRCAADGCGTSQPRGAFCVPSTPRRL
jgi:hypothetical protein